MQNMRTFLKFFLFTFIVSFSQVACGPLDVDSLNEDVVESFSKKAKMANPLGSNINSLGNKNLGGIAATPTQEADLEAIRRKTSLIKICVLGVGGAGTNMVSAIQKNRDTVDRSKKELEELLTFQEMVQQGAKGGLSAAKQAVLDQALDDIGLSSEEYSEVEQRIDQRIKELNTIIASEFLHKDVDLFAANTDIQSLSVSGVSKDNQILLVREDGVNKGLGAGSNPAIGCNAAKNTLETVMAKVGHANILFIVAGLGGGTGTGAVKVIAEEAKKRGILVIVVVTTPSMIEGPVRRKHAEAALAELVPPVLDTLIEVSNAKLEAVAMKDAKISFDNAYAMSDDILIKAVKGISTLLLTTGKVNVDFADVKTVVEDHGYAIMGVGTAKGTGRALEAVKNAIKSPLLENVSVCGARGLIVNIRGGKSMCYSEVVEVQKLVNELVQSSGLDVDTHVIAGSGIDESLGDMLEVTIIATGLRRDETTGEDPLFKKQKLNENVSAPAKQKPAGRNKSEESNLQAKSEEVAIRPGANRKRRK